MKATFVSETENHIVISLDITQNELKACAAGLANSTEYLVSTLENAYREAIGINAEDDPDGYKSEEIPAHEQFAPIVEKIKEASEENMSIKSEINTENRLPFKVKDYKGVQIERVNDPQDGLSPEELMKDRIMSKIIENNDIYIPEEQLENEVKYTFVGLAQNLKYRAMMSGDFAEYNKFSTGTNREEFRQNVVRQLKIEMILKSIIEQERFVVNREELESEAEAMAKRQHVTVDMIKNFFGKDLLSIKEDLIIAKAMDFVYDYADIIEA